MFKILEKFFECPKLETRSKIETGASETSRIEFRVETVKWYRSIKIPYSDFKILFKSLKYIQSSLKSVIKYSWYGKGRDNQMLKQALQSVAANELQILMYDETVLRISLNNELSSLKDV